MGCFPACFTSANIRKHRKPVAVTPSTQLQHQIDEAVRFEPTKLDDIVKPITESNVVEEQTKSDAKEKKVTFGLVEESIDEKKEEAPKKIEPILGCLETSVVTVVSLNHRYENCSNSENDEEEGVIDLSGSDLNGDDYGDDEVESSKEIVVQEPESSESLFSISIDSRKQISNAEEDEKEVNSPMPKPKPIENSSSSHSVLSPIENLGRWKDVKAKAIPLASKNQEKENMNAEQDSNIPISPEPSLELSKHFTKRQVKSNDLKLGDQETGVDTSLSSWLVECETTPKSSASDNSVGSLTCERVSSSKSLGDRPVLGEWTSEELKQLSNSSTPNQWRSADQMLIIGTVGSYWSHTGQGTDSDSNSSCRGKENTAGRNIEDEKVKWKTMPLAANLEPVLDMGILGA